MTSTGIGAFWLAAYLIFKVRRAFARLQLNAKTRRNAHKCDIGNNLVTYVVYRLKRRHNYTNILVCAKKTKLGQ